MKENKILTFINNITITSKLLFGFGLVFITFGILSLVILNNLENERATLQTVSTLTENSSRILVINRELSDIQRLVNVYSVTGGDSVLKKIETIYLKLNKELKIVGKTTTSEKRRSLISSLSSILSTYGENISSLANRYDYRDQLIEEKLPKAFNDGVLFLENEISVQANSPAKMIEAERVLNRWYQINHFAFNFLEKKKYKYKKEVEVLLNDLLLFSRSESNFNIEFTKYIETYKDIFNQSIQASRIYSSLVNVIMAGTSIEFTSISNQLREESITELSNLLIKSDHSFQNSKNIVYLSLITTLFLLILIGFYFQVSIANRIKRLSKVFQSFIDGNLNLSIQGLNRKDEIGQLANAASKYRDVSLLVKKEKARVEELSKSRTDFLVTMSHEIRTPMNAIISCTNILLSDIEESCNSEQIELLSTVKRSGDSLLVLINDILDFSKIESGKINLENKSFSLNDCIEDVITLLKPIASSKGVLLELTISKETPTFIRGDIIRLKQVLLNLVGNGIKFTKDYVKVSVNTKSIKGKEVKLSFHVKDNGIGVDENTKKHLFKEFSQADASTTRKYGGTGLGLAICKGIIDEMDGLLDVTTAEGGGAEFYFEITSTIEKQEKISNKKKYLSEAHQKSIDTSLKILVAEDNSVNQMVIRKLLDRLGLSIDIVENGYDAVNSIKSTEYDIVFMDQHMPELDGVDATVIIRKLNISQPKIFALTASAFKEDEERCIEAGMDGFLTKPINTESLISILSEYSIAKNTNLKLKKIS